MPQAIPRSALAFLVAVLSSAVASAEPATQPVRLTIPYVATRHDAVRDMLYLADVAKEDVVYDLGSGDGRIVIAAVRDFGARRAVGIERDPQLVRQSRDNARRANVHEDRARFTEGDLFTADFDDASVVTLFLGHEPNLRLRPLLFQRLKPGTRIVSHQFGMGEWTPEKFLTVRTVLLGMYGSAHNPYQDNPRVPDYIGYESPFGHDTVGVWVVPAPVAGIWRGRVDTSQGPQDLEITLQQRLTEVTGRFRLAGANEAQGWVRVDLWGSHLRYWCIPEGAAMGSLELRFDGRVDGDAIKGTHAVVENGRVREQSWEARRAAGDLTGNWPWSRADAAPEKALRIERREGRYVAGIVDGDTTLPVRDFYDFGGGFYFTHLVGRDADGGSITINKNTGWIIGQGVINDRRLTGTIEFHPYESSTESRTQRWEAGSNDD